MQNHLNRWYDPSVGRWLSADPIGFAAGDANLARYVGNQPTTAADPAGLAEGACRYSLVTEARLRAYAQRIAAELSREDPRSERSYLLRASLQYEIARCDEPGLSWEECQWREFMARYGEPSTPVITADTRTAEQWERDHLR